MHNVTKWPDTLQKSYSKYLKCAWLFRAIMHEEVILIIAFISSTKPLFILLGCLSGLDYNTSIHGGHARSKIR